MKQHIIPIFLLLGIFMMVGLTSAANTVTLVTPAEDASISSATSLLNATLDTNDGTITNMTFYYHDGSSWTQIATIANTSTDQTVWNTTWDSTSIIDVNDYVFNSTATQNDGTHVSTDNSTGVDIDNGNPTSSFSSSSFSDNLHLVKDTNFTAAIDADSTIGISSCNLYFTNENGVVDKKQSVSASGNACSTSTDADTLGLSINEAYTVAMEATDGNGDAVNSSSRTLVITPSSAGGGGVAIPQEQLGEDFGSTVSDKAKGLRNNISKITQRVSDFVNSILNSIKNIFNR